MTYAWHFVGATLRDGCPIPKDGVTLRHTGPVIPCEQGLHASAQPFDALNFAPGATLCLVRCGGKIIHHAGDKLACSKRTIIARMDATDMLRYYSRMQALSVVHLWAAPQVVLDYLMTGDESFGSDAEAAAGAAAEAAAGAAGAAAWDAAWAAQAAAWDVALAAGAAAWDAAWAAQAAAWDVALDVARSDFNSLVYECFEGPLAQIGWRP